MGGMSGCRVSEGSRIFVEVTLECRECRRTGKTELDGIRVSSRGHGGRDTRSGRSHIYHEFMMHAHMGKLLLFDATTWPVCHGNRQAFKPHAG